MAQAGGAAQHLQNITATGRDPLVLESCPRSGSHLEVWSAIAILNVGDPQDFQIRVHADDLRSNNFIVGIVPHEATLPESPILNERRFKETYPQTYSLHTLDLGKTLGVGSKTGLPQKFKVGDVLTMTYSHEGLTFTLRGKTFAYPAVKKCKDYRPCIFLPLANQTVFVNGAGLKRKSKALDCNARLWAERKFTDAEVRCDGRSFPVHKAIVAMGSLVIERMLESGMRETREAVIQIEDAQPEAVNAMLQYLYTSTVAEGVDVAELFTLAHRYDVHGLVEEAGKKMLTDLTAENIKSRARTLMLRKDSTTADLWHAMLKRLREDENEDLLRGLLEELLLS